MNGSPGPDLPPLQSLLFPRTLHGLWSGPVPRMPTGPNPSPQWLRSSVHWHDGQRQTGSRAAHRHAHTCDTFPLCILEQLKDRAHTRTAIRITLRPKLKRPLCSRTGNAGRGAWIGVHECVAGGPLPQTASRGGGGTRNDEVWLPALSRSSEKPLKRPRVREGQTRFQHKDVMVPST